MILCLTGLSCTGKTTLSKLLVQNKKYVLISVRKVSHKLAIKYGYTRTRDWLKNISIEEYLAKCRTAIMNSICENQINYIIDDLFDIQLWHEVSSEYKCELISLSLPIDIRIERMQKREHLNYVEAQKELNFLDEWKQKFGIEKVMNEASIHIETINCNAFENIKFRID